MIKMPAARKALAIPMSTVMAAATRASFLTLISLSVVLPSGTLGSLNIKELVFAASIISFLGYIIFSRRHLSIDSLRALLAWGLSVAFLLLWTVLGLTRGSSEQTQAISAFSGFLVTSSMVFLSYILYREGIYSLKSFLRVIIVSAFVFAALKVAIVILIYLNIVTFETVRSFFRNFMDYSFISMPIGPGVVRMQFINDIITPFMLFFIPVANRFGARKWRHAGVVMMIIMALSIFLAFSRFIFVLTVALLIMWLFFFALRRLASVVLTLTALLLIGAGAAFYIDEISSVIKTRFFSPAVASSDGVRTAQFKALLIEAGEYPLLGKGVGGYAEHYISSKSKPYSYEMQWLAFLLQFGAIGFALLLFPVLWIGWRLSLFWRTGLGSFLLGAYSMWLLSGLTNPYLVSSSSSVVFSIFLLTSVALKFVDTGSSTSALVLRGP